MSRVLITAIGSFSADVVIENLKRSNYIVGCDIYHENWVANSKSVNAFYKINSKSLGASYLDELVTIIKKECIEYVIPLTDLEIDLLNVNRNIFSELKVVLCMSPSEAVRICRDKFETYNYLNENGIKELIPTRLWDKECCWRYPVIIKPVSGRSSEGVIKIDNPSDYDYLYRKLNKDKYIVQPYYEGKLICVDIITDGEGYYGMPREELLRTDRGAGLSVKIFHDNDVVDLAVNIAKQLGVRGCVNIEFLQVEGRYYFLECNPRFSGGVKFSCMAGYDFVNNHLNYFKQAKVECLNDYEDIFLTRKYIEIIME